jgi:predicted dehydrogenase
MNCCEGGQSGSKGETEVALKTILIGLGTMGTQWAEALNRSAEYETVAFVSPSQERRDRLKEKLALKEFPGFVTVTEALRQVDADLAIVATPAYLHFETCLAALDRGLPVIVEKPLETEWQKAKAIVEEARRKNLLLLVDQNYRSTAPLWTLRRVVQEGELGKPGFATVIHHRNRKGAGTYQQKMPNPTLLDMSIHHLDTMRFVFGHEVVSVIAHSWNPHWSDYAGDANVDLFIEFEDGLWLTYSGSNVSRGITIHPFANWRIECEQGGVYLESIGFNLELSRVPATAQPGYKERIEFDSLPLENQAYVLRHFKECLDSGSEPETSGRDNLKTLAIAMAAIASSERGERVWLKEFLEWVG